MTEYLTEENFTIRRVHRAPRALVFACMTQPEHLTHFWGPKGMHTPLENIIVDLRPDGAFETTMVNSVNGDTYTMRARYVSVSPTSFLSWREVDSGVLTENRFTDLGDRTTEVVTTQSGLPARMRTPEARAGWVTGVDRGVTYTESLAAEAAS